MSQPQIVRTMPFSDWLQVGKDLYGEDITAWEFICPSCDQIQSIQFFLSEGVKDERAYSECIGRHKAGIGCDWAAYGLFSGPRELLDEDGEHKSYVFYFAKEVVA